MQSAGRVRGAQIGPAERVGMQAAAIDLDAQQFLKPNVGDPHIAAEMVDQRELARLVRGFEGHARQAELGSKTIRKRAIEDAVIVEEPNALCRLDRKSVV